MKVVIFNHPFSDFYTSYNRLYNGVAPYLAEIAAPHRALCFNVVGRLRKRIPLPSALEYLAPYVVPDDTDYSFFSSYYRFGEPARFNHKEFYAFKPGSIIITSFAYCYFEGLKDMVRYVKSLSDVPVIIGGAGPSSRPEYYLEQSGADYVCVGPAELSLKKLLDVLEEGGPVRVDNVYSRDSAVSVDLNRDYEFKPFISRRKKTVQLQLTRGCPKKCTYCSVSILSGKKYRCSSLESVKEAVAGLYEECSAGGGEEKNDGKGRAIRHFDFEDDSISFNSSYLLAVIEIIKTYFPEARFSCENGIDFTTLDEPLIAQLAEAGFSGWNLSLTSVNSAVLNDKKRGYTRERFDGVTGFLTGLPESLIKPVIVYYITGLPGDSGMSVFESLVYLASKQVIIGISAFYPVPSTKEAERITGELEPLLTKGTSFYPWAQLRSKEQVTFFLLSRFINVVKKYKSSDWENFKTANLPAEDPTLAGIYYSFQKRGIYYVYEDCFKKHPLDSKIEELFFTWFYRGGKIITVNGEVFDRDFLTNLSILT